MSPSRRERRLDVSGLRTRNIEAMRSDLKKLRESRETGVAPRLKILLPEPTEAVHRKFLAS